MNEATTTLTRAETRLVFGGDAKSLQSFVTEVRMVNSRSTRGGEIARGMAGGATQTLSQGINNIGAGIWPLLRHPIGSVKGIVFRNAIDRPMTVESTDNSLNPQSCCARALQLTQRNNCFRSSTVANAVAG
jgi:hypothetical protein